MKTRFALRKEAVRLQLQGISKAEIARRLKASRRWVYRWITRYDSKQGAKSLEDRSHAPKHRKPYLWVRQNQASRAKKQANTATCKLILGYRWQFSR